MSYVPPAPPAQHEGAHLPFLRAARAHPLLIAVVVLVAAATSIALVKTRTPEYESTAQVLVTPTSNDGVYAGLPVVTESSADPARTLQTATTILKSAAASTDAARTLGDPWTPTSVGRAIQVQPQGESDVVAITGSASDAASAQRVATAYARSALAVRAAEMGGQAGVLIDQLEERLKGLAPGDPTAAQIAAQVAALTTVQNGHDPNFSLLQGGAGPGAETGSSAKLLVVLAILAGLALAIGIATLIEYLNRRVRDEDEVLALYPLPVLARVPLLPSTSRDVVAAELIPPRVREAFRTLQVQLQPHGPSSQSHGGRAIMFTSPTAGDGKTASVANFALVLAAANARVILFDFDLRKPDLAARLRVHADYMDFFRTNTTLDEVLVDLPTAPGVRVIGARAQGQVAPLLEAVSRRMPELLDEARELADYVLIDTAPVGAVSDALRIAPAVDDLVLVTRPGNTDRTDLQHSRELLERMGHTPSGLAGRRRCRRRRGVRRLRRLGGARGRRAVARRRGRLAASERTPVARPSPARRGAARTRASAVGAMASRPALLPRAPQRGSLPLAAGSVVASALLAALVVHDAKLAVVLLGAVCFVPIALLRLPLAVGCWVALLFFARVPGFSAVPDHLLVLIAACWVGLMIDRRIAVREALTDAQWPLLAMAAFTLWTLLTLAWAPDAGVSTLAIRDMLYADLGFVLILGTMLRREHVRLLATAFVIGATLSVLYGVAKGGLSGGGGYVVDLDGRFQAGSGDPNYLGAVLVPAIVLAAGLMPRRSALARMGLGLAIVVCAIGLAATQSRGGLIAASWRALVAFAIWRGRRLAIAAVIALAGAVTAAFFLLSPSAWERIGSGNNSGSGRIDIWNVAWRVVSDHPIAGVGAGQFAQVSPHYVQQPGALDYVSLIVEKQIVVHNVYLQLWVETGIVGLMLFLLVVGVSLRFCWRALRAFEEQRDAEMVALARTALLALLGTLAASFFLSNVASRQLWVLLAFGPVMAGVAVRQERAAVRELETAWRRGP